MKVKVNDEFKLVVLVGIMLLVLVISGFLIGVISTSACCPTDVPPPITDTPVPPVETSTPEPTITPEPKLPTATPTPGITDNPNPTPTGDNPPNEKKKPTATWDCIKEYNEEKCLPKTGIGDGNNKIPIHVNIGLTFILLIICVCIIIGSRRARNGR